jgi:hypothetical protein
MAASLPTRLLKFPRDIQLFVRATLKLMRKKRNHQDKQIFQVQLKLISVSTMSYTYSMGSKAVGGVDTELAETPSVYINRQKSSIYI